MTLLKTQTRRALIKSIGATTIWVSPIVQMVKLPLHAQISSTVCSAQVVPGIEVRAIDVNTNGNISCIASGIITSNGYTEVLEKIGCTNPANGSLQGALERSGIYILEVSAPGYIGRTINSINVTEDECHVTTSSLDVTLTPV